MPSTIINLAELRNLGPIEPGSVLLIGTDHEPETLRQARDVLVAVAGHDQFVVVVADNWELLDRTEVLQLRDLLNDLLRSTEN